MKALYLVMVAAVALPACSSMNTESAAPRKCDEDRVAIVSIENDKRIVVSPEPIVVCKQNAHITWSFDSDVPSTYKFVDQAPNGKKSIDFKDPSQFDECKAHPNGRSFTCKDKKDATGTYKYIIYLVGPTGQLESVDPHVVND
jgi:hypothetical protein